MEEDKGKMIQCRILKISSRKMSPSLTEELRTPFDAASAYRMSWMMCITFTPLYRRMALIYSRACQGVFNPTNEAMPCSDFSGA